MSVTGQAGTATAGQIVPPPDHQQRMKQPGPAGGGGGVAPGQVRRDPPLQEHQEFDSWRHQTHQPQQPGYNPMSSMASDPYLSSFYAGSYHYPGFGVGDGKIDCVCFLDTFDLLKYSIYFRYLV